MEVIKIQNEDEFNSAINDGVCLVDFFATWCGPCRMLSPIVEQVAKTRKDVKVLKVDVDDFYDLAKSFGIMSVPTLILFKNGQIKQKNIGLVTLEKINNMIDSI